MTRANQLAAALDRFLAVSPDVEGAAIVSPDGFAMASALPAYVEEDRLAAMSAALLILGERSATELGKGNLAQIFVEGPHGHVVIMAAGESAVLVAVTARAAKVGLVLFEMRQAAARVGEIMSGPGLPDDERADGIDSRPESSYSPAEQPEPARVPSDDSAADDLNGFIDLREGEAHGAEGA